MFFKKQRDFSGPWFPCCMGVTIEPPQRQYLTHRDHVSITNETIEGPVNEIISPVHTDPPWQTTQPCFSMGFQGMPTPAGEGICFHPLFF